MPLKKIYELINRFMPAIVGLCIILESAFFLIATPPGHIPDVWAHVYRVSGIVNGDVVVKPVHARSMLQNVSSGAVGGTVDCAWLDYSLAQYDGYDPAVALLESLPSDACANTSSGTVDLPYNNAGINSPVAYTPQVIGVAAGKLFGLSASTTYRLAEIIMLAVYAVFMFLAVNALRAWRVPIGVLLSLPPIVKRASFAFSADSFTQAVVLLFSCLLIREILGPRSIMRHVWQLAVVGLVMAMCKFIYVPLVLLMLPLMWASRCSGQQVMIFSRKRAVPVLGSITLCAAWIMFWLKINDWYTTTPMLVSYGQMNAHKHALLTQPTVMLDAVHDILWSILHAQANLNNASDHRGIAVCWMLIACILLELFIASVMQFGTRFIQANPQTAAKQDTHVTHKSPNLLYLWVIALFCIGIILLTYLALWLQYNPADSLGVNGVQYRYFLPLAVLFGFVFLETAKQTQLNLFQLRPHAAITRGQAGR